MNNNNSLSMARSAQATRRRKVLLSLGEWLVVLGTFGCGLTLTAGVYRAAKASVEARAEAHFHRDATRLEGEIHRRLAEADRGLQAMGTSIQVKGLFDQTQFRDYVAARNIADEFPFIRGFGFIERVKHEDLQGYVEAVRRSGEPEFAVQTSGGAPDHFIVRQIEPLSRNPEAIGLDLGADPSSRQAIESAVLTGDARLMSPMPLVHNNPDGWGWLLLRPVYRDARVDGTPAITAASRQQQLTGVLYAPIVARDLLELVLSDGEFHVDLHLYDASAAADGFLVFDTTSLPGRDATLLAERHFKTRRLFAWGGRTLALEIGSTPALDAEADPLLPDMLALAGGGLSVLLAGMAWLLLSGRRRAERRAAQMSVDLAQARDAAESANRAKSDFLANMSHELRTPMNGVLGMLQLLRATPVSPRQRDYLGKTEQAARSLLQLLDQILDFSKIEAGWMELEAHPFLLDDLLGDLSLLLSTSIGSKPLEAVFDIDPAVPQRLVGDDSRLRQVLVNLAGNAVKFTEHGEVRLTVRCARVQGQQVQLRFEVRDTGIGIAPQDQAQIFRSFQQADASTTRRYGGTGLGLAISRDLVRLMGGELELESELGRGSCFSFTVPLESSGEVAARTSTARVLFVEPNVRAHAALLQHARALGWTAAAHGSAQSAVAADPGRWDAVFVACNGEPLDLPQSLARSFTVAMASGPGAQALAAPEAMRRVGVDAVVIKPITASMLQQAIEQASAEDAAEPQAPPQARGPLSSLRLLVVEDNSLNQEVARSLLAGQGAEVRVAGDGRQALELLRAEPGSFDAVLMDIQMPVMDGYTATRTIREELGLRLPVIALTANARAEDRLACLQHGMDDHVSKPFHVQELVSTLLRHTHHAAGRSPAAPCAAPEQLAQPG